MNALIKRGNAALTVLSKQQALRTRRIRLATIRQACETLCYIQQDSARTPTKGADRG